MSSSLILCNNNGLHLKWIVMCDEKWILCDNQQWPALWLNWEEAPKHFPKPYFESWSLFGGLLLVWSTTAFWILAKSLYMRSILSKSMRCTENCNTCSQHWSKERDQFSLTTPDCTLHKQNFKSWMNRATKFCLIGHIHVTSCQPTTTSSSNSTTLCRKNAFIISRMQKMLFKGSSNPEA